MAGIDRISGVILSVHHGPSIPLGQSVAKGEMSSETLA